MRGGMGALVGGNGTGVLFEMKGRYVVGPLDPGFEAVQARGGGRIAGFPEELAPKSINRIIVDL